MKQIRDNRNDRSFADCIKQLDQLVSTPTIESPGIRSSRHKNDRKEKYEIKEIFERLLKESFWTLKEVLTASEASAYLGMSESYLYKLTSSKQIPYYKPNGKLIYFNRKELCAWAMQNHVLPLGVNNQLVCDGHE